MKKIILFLFVSVQLTAQSLTPVQYLFMQGNNINTVFSTNGVFNYDKVTFSDNRAGFLWPVTSPTRIAVNYASGFMIAAKVGTQRELRAAGSHYDSHFSPGNIPVIGQVPPNSVCSDSSWRGYLVQLTDPSLFGGGTRVKFAGGRQYTFNYDSWANWPVDKGAPFVEVNGIPGYQPSWNGDRPGIGKGMTARPIELSFMVYMDYTNCTNNYHTASIGLPGGTLPLGVEIQQLVFMFDCYPLQDMYFMKLRIINKSSEVWDSTYFALVNDPDLGYWLDDAGGVDTSRHMVLSYNADNDDQDYGTNPPAHGYRILQSPLRYTGSTSDTAKLPYDTITGYKLNGLTSNFMIVNGSPDTCTNDPNNAIQVYNYMRGKNGCGVTKINHVTGQPTLFSHSGDACNRIGWLDSIVSGHNIRDWAGSGPFTMNSGDTQIAVISYIITRDGGNNHLNVCALQSLSDSALFHYYNDFRLCIPIGIQPISTEIPQTFALLQNYPNPFNPTTKIRFSIPVFAETGSHRNVTMRIYDALGREIETLVNEQLNPGTYEVDWNALNYPSGVYFYSLTAGTFTQTKKMVMIK